jgi:hypothetical protein
MIEYEKSQVRKKAVLPSLGFQDCVPLSLYNKRLAKRTAKILSNQRVYS